MNNLFGTLLQMLGAQPRVGNFGPAGYDPDVDAQAQANAIAQANYQQCNHRAQQQMQNPLGQALGLADNTNNMWEIIPDTLVYQQAMNDYRRAREAQMMEYQQAQQTSSQQKPRPTIAETRAMMLLFDHMTPQQQADFEQHGYFHVKGNKTGKTYRLHYGRVSFNIHELDDKGQMAAKLCFYPVHRDEWGAHSMVPGDHLYGQKVSLELDETATLKIANREECFSLRTAQQQAREIYGVLTDNI